MTYAVRIMEHGTQFDYVEGKRYRANKSIFKFLVKHNFAFTFGCTKKYVEKDPHYVVVFLKPTHLLQCDTMEKSDYNRYLNERLRVKLEKMKKWLD